MKALGIDIGGSSLKAAPVDLDNGSLLANRLRIETPHPATPTAIAEAVNQIVTHFNWNGPIGGGLPAVVHNGIVCSAANIDHSWINMDASTLFKKHTGKDVAVINDADAAGIAEMRYGAGREAKGTTIMVTAGTGLGTALFRDNTLIPNTELGHLQIYNQDAEHYASAAVRIKHNLSYQQWAVRFNKFLQHLHDLFRPDLIIVGGEISTYYQEFSPYLSVSSKIVPATLKNNAGIIGAAFATRPQA